MKKNILKKASVGMALGITLGLTLLPFLALAQVPGPIITNPNQITDLVQRILNWVAGIVMTISLIMLLYAAILFLTAGTSETAHTSAKNVLIYAIVGIAVAILAFSVQPLLTAILGRQF
ncbi:MAG: TrbC/VirB2 family protein [Candidatus Azambacteria bacterium]|nr:TrbC/VirB2 family protein [Candidatus Azambacteria bacterium]